MQAANTKLSCAANRALSSVANGANLILPYNRYGDRLVRLLEHLVSHQRLPKPNSGLFNDRLYYMLVSGELESPLRQKISDKELVKEYIASKVGNRYVVPTIAVLHSFAEATSYDYPDRCVVKPTHGFGQVIIRSNSEVSDFDRIREWFSMNFYQSEREANYKFLVPKVIVEPILFDDPNLEDFKFFCVNGRPKLIQVDFDRYMNHTRCLYTTSWRKQEFGFSYPIGRDVERPHNLLSMIEIAKALSAEFDFIRVDLYSDGTTIFVGELTNVPEGGYGRFFPREAERTASDILFGST